MIPGPGICRNARRFGNRPTASAGSGAVRVDAEPFSRPDQPRLYAPPAPITTFEATSGAR